MKILLIALTDTYECLLPALEEKNHQYKLITELSRPGNHNIYYGGPGTVEWVKEEIRKYSPDLVINNMAGLLLPKSDSYTYFGNTEESSRLEMNKWETRQTVKSLGFDFLFPEVVAECNLDEMTYFPYTTYLKSKGNDTFCQAWKVTPDTDLNYHNRVLQHHNRIKCPAYVERAVDFEVEGCCQFRIANGSYNLTSVQGIYGNPSGYKQLVGTSDWRDDTYMGDLTPDQHKVVTEKCGEWLEYAATLGGNYEGNIGTGITSDLDVYWFEHNSRQSMYSQFVGDADSWIDSFTKNTNENFWEFPHGESLRTQIG
jgi:hypothetical protein